MENKDLIEKISSLRERIRRGEKIKGEVIPTFRALCCDKPFDGIIEAGCHEAQCIWNYFIHCSRCIYGTSLAKLLPRERRLYTNETDLCDCSDKMKRRMALALFDLHWRLRYSQVMIRHEVISEFFCLYTKRIFDANEILENDSHDPNSLSGYEIKCEGCDNSTHNLGHYLSSIAGIGSECSCSKLDPL